MKQCLRKGILLTLVLSLLLFVATVNADALNSNLASEVFVATNSNIQESVNATNVTNTTDATIAAAAAAFVKPDLWYRTNSGLWYYFENEWTTTRTGWFVDPRDGQTYYLKPENGIMAVGWMKIGDNEYYFYDNKEAENCWFELGGGFYEKWLNGQPSYGSMFRGCKTPDGKMVDMDGKLIK